MTSAPIHTATIETQPIDGVTYYLPATVDEVCFLVNQAWQTNTVVCLRGAAHSRPLISSLEAEATAGRLYMILSKLDSVHFDDNLKQVAVGGGCHLGLDPSDPTTPPNASTLANSLLYQLDQHRPDLTKPLLGWAIPDMGGIIHQTIGGFLSTGSSGGSLQHSFNDMLLSLTLVTCGANGAQLQTFSRNDPRYTPDNNPFFAVGVGLGLFGVIVSATFQCVDSFNIVGQEATTLEADCPIDMFGDKPALPSLANFFRNTPYKRMMWWPQIGVEKMLVWQARPIPVAADFVPKPYEEIPVIKIFGQETPIPAEIAADLMMSGFGNVPAFLHELLGDSLLYKTLMALGRDYIVPTLLNLFVKVDGPDGPQKFQDSWYNGIPMDNRVSDLLMPVWFTELWFPIDNGPTVLSQLRAYFAQYPDRVGTFSYEIYPAKASEFWLSPAYGTDVFRIDMFWFGDNPGSPANVFYPEFWNLLEPLSFRPHWGKFLPASTSGEGTTYLTRRYPNFDKWMALRNQTDPHQVFVSDYWRNHLGIERLVHSSVEEELVSQ